MEILQPPDWPRPRGYSNGVAAEGRLVFVAGTIGWNPVTEKVEEPSLAGQFRVALENIVAILAEAGAKPEHLVRLTWFITDTDEYLASLNDVGRAYREVIGKHYPPMAAIGVAKLIEEGAKLEIEATAVVPAGS